MKQGQHLEVRTPRRRAGKPCGMMPVNMASRSLEACSRRASKSVALGDAMHHSNDPEHFMVLTKRAAIENSSIFIKAEELSQSECALVTALNPTLNAVGD